MMEDAQVRNLTAEVRNLQMQVQQLLSNTNKDEELQYGQPNRINAYFGFPGIIIPYYPESGDLTALPDNWHECDGTNGTPDMRGQTAIGANGTYSFGTGYGAATVTITHGDSNSGTTGQHSHGPGGLGLGVPSGIPTTIAWKHTEDTGLTGNHSHTVNDIPDHTGVSTIQPSLALYWIMRLS